MKYQMKIDITVSKSTCFYYWVQALSEWDARQPEIETHAYFKEKAGTLSSLQTNALTMIKHILLNSKEPRWVLSELYCNRIASLEAVEIRHLARSFETLFANLWVDIEQPLAARRQKLQQSDLSQFNIPLKQIAQFLGSPFQLDKSTTVYLIQNAPFAPSAGHAINNTDFVLLHPAGREHTSDTNSTICTLVHELIHKIEFQASTARKLYKDSYDSIISPSGKLAPTGYTWKGLYSETLVYCFANKITGGYLRPQIFNKPLPSVEEMRAGFKRLLDSDRATTNDRIAWVALNIQEEVTSKMNEGRQIDRRAVDGVSRLFLKYF